MDKSQNSQKHLWLKDHLLWICPIVGVIAGVIVLWLYGFGVWTALAFFFLAACPLTVAWVLIIERQLRPNAGENESNGWRPNRKRR